jgi:hypothetical protein
MDIIFDQGVKLQRSVLGPVADLPVSPLPTYCVEKLADKSEDPRFIPEIEYKLYLLELS